MKKPIQLTKSTNPARESIDRSPWWRGFLLIPLAVGFACLALASSSRAVSPPPDGGYLNQNTAEGENALFNLKTADTIRPPVITRFIAIRPAS